MADRSRSRSPRNQEMPLEATPLTYADLIAENGNLRRQIERFEAENEGLKAELHSRKYFRVEALPETARAALDIVCKHDADPRVESQRRTIARQQKSNRKMVDMCFEMSRGVGIRMGIVFTHYLRTHGYPMDTLENRLLMESSMTLDQFISNSIRARDALQNTREALQNTREALEDTRQYLPSLPDLGHGRKHSIRPISQLKGELLRSHSWNLKPSVEWHVRL